MLCTPRRVATSATRRAPTSWVTSAATVLIESANAVRNGVEAEFDAALDAFYDEWSHGTSSPARFEKEYLLAVGTRR